MNTNSKALHHKGKRHSAGHLRQTIKQITIVDIAKRMILSPSTVSRSLRDLPGISRITKNGVRKTAKRLGYSPNTDAQKFNK